MANDADWEQYTEQTYKGKPSGNAEFAREVRKTPLEADAILDLVWNNYQYANDSYYNCLWIPVTMRVEEYFAQRDKPNGN